MIDYIGFSIGTSTECLFVDKFANWNFDVLTFEEEKKREKTTKDHLSKDKNQQLTQPTYNV